MQTAHPAGQLARSPSGVVAGPVLWLVLPFSSGSVVQSSPPGVRASTNRKSQSCSVSYEVQNVRSPPPAGTAISRVRRLYATSEICE